MQRLTPLVPIYMVVGLARKYPSKRAFITGAGSGLGFAFAELLAKEGWKLAITDVSAERLSVVSEKLTALGGIPSIYNFDVSDHAKFKEATADFVLKHGGIDIGINSAGIGCGGPIDELSIEIYRKVVDVNLLGTVNGCHLFVPVMKEQGSGHILNIASAAAFVSAPRMSAYNMTKAGVVSLSETLRSELFENGINVTVLMPSYVRTNIGEDAIGTVDDIRRAKYLVGSSVLTADAVAKETLMKMQSGDLYVVMDDEARFLWRFKRLFPDRFWRAVAGELKQRLAKIDQS